MADLFISYRRKPSAALALLIQEKLKNKHAVDAYVDTTRTDSTKVQFPDRLMQAIADAPVFLCLLADSTLDSEWVMKEIQRAYELKKFCIPVFQESYVPPAQPTDAVNYLLNHDGVHVLDLKNIFIDESIDRIAALARRPMPAPPPPPTRPRPLIFALIGVLILAGIFALSLLNPQPPADSETITPSIAPQSTTAVAQAQTPPTETPTDLPARDIAVATRDAFFTQTATQWTPTPSATFTPTIDQPGTVNAELTALQAEALTAAALMWTDTPTLIPPTLTPTPEPSSTPTVTLTPPVTTSPTVTPTPTLSLEEALIQGKIRVVGSSSEGCLSSALSPNNEFFAVGGEGLYRLSNGQKVFDISGNYLNFSSDGQFLSVTNDGIYRVSDGQKILEAVGSPLFSSDGTLVAVSGDGVYQLGDGQKLFEIVGSPSFSPDGTLLAVGRDGVYEISSRLKLFDIRGTASRFRVNGTFLEVANDGLYRVSDGEKLIDSDNFVWVSPNGEFFAVTDDAVYQSSDGQKLFEIDGVPTFSPDSTLVALPYDGVYRNSNGEKLFDISGYNPIFSLDGTLLAVSRDGVYQVADGQKLLEVNDTITLGPDETLVAVSRDGVYQIADGQKLFDIYGISVTNFSPDGSLLAVSRDGIYRVSDGQRLLRADIRFTSFLSDYILRENCKVWLPDANVVNLQGRVIELANIRLAASVEAGLVDVARTGTQLLVLGKNSAGDWYYTNMGWISAPLVSLDGDPADLTVIGD